MKFRIFVFIFLFALPLFAGVTVNVNGVNYPIPQTNERGWGNAVTTWIQAISANTLQPKGGVFTLSEDIDFGASFGLKSSYLLSRSANPATSGILRLARTDQIAFRNFDNTSNLFLTVDASNRLTFNGVPLSTEAGAGVLTGKTIDGDNNTLLDISITSLKTVLADANKILARDATGAVISSALDADILSISNIDDSEIKSGANIQRTKLAAGSANHVLINDGSGVLSSEAQLAKSRGGTGQDNSSLNFPTSGTLATLAGAEALTNKDIDGGTASNTSRITLPKNTKANLDGLTRKAGTVFFSTDEQKFYGDNGTSIIDLGGGAFQVSSLQTIASNGSITVSNKSDRQLIKAVSTGGPVLLNLNPFGVTTAPEGKEVVIVCDSETNSLIFSYLDTDDGAIGNFETIECAKNYPIKALRFNNRWLIQRGF